MLLKTLQAIFERDLNRLKKEIELYQDEKIMWSIDNSISNSAGNLCLHLAGNLKTFVGVHMGNSDYVRDRKFEFAGKDVPKKELLKSVDETIDVVNFTLSNMTEEDLQRDFPIQVFAERSTNEFMLIHLATHLGYHLGQINYHRRLLDMLSA